MPIPYNDVLLPEWLFFFSKDKTPGASPTDSLNLISSLNEGNRWESAVAPSLLPKLKSIFITQSCLEVMTIQELISFSAWFKANKFNVYLTSQDDEHNKKFTLLNEEVSASVFETLTSFNIEKDYEIVATTFTLARDHVVVLNNLNTLEMKNCLEQYQSISTQDNHCIFTGCSILFNKDLTQEAKSMLDNTEITQKGTAIKYLLKHEPIYLKKYIKDFNKLDNNFRPLEYIRLCDNIEIAKEIYLEYTSGIYKEDIPEVFNKLQDIQLERQYIENLDKPKVPVVLPTSSSTLLQAKLQALSKKEISEIFNFINNDQKTDKYSVNFEAGEILELVTFFPEQYLTLSSTVKHNLITYILSNIDLFSDPRTGYLLEGIDHNLAKDLILNNTLNDLNSLKLITSLLTLFQNNYEMIETLNQKREFIQNLLEPKLQTESNYLSTISDYIPYLSKPFLEKIILEYKHIKSDTRDLATLIHDLENHHSTFIKPLLTKLNETGHFCQIGPKIASIYLKHAPELMRDTKREIRTNEDFIYMSHSFIHYLKTCQTKKY